MNLLSPPRVLASLHLVTLLGVGGAACAPVGAMRDERPAVDVAADLDALRGRIAAILTREGVPGAGIALVDREGVIWSGGVGLADVASDRPVAADTPFRLGSISKSVVGLAVMRAGERGELQLDTRLREIAPEVPFANPWEDTHPVRIAHLLEHTAGFEFARWNEEWDLGAEPRPLIDALAVNPRSRHSRWPPGTRMSYSNEGYLAAGYLLEKASGRSFDELMRAEIFAPMGMNDAAFRLTPQTRARLASGHGSSGAVPYYEDMQRPAANLLATPLDMARYVRFWLGRGALDGRQLLSAANVARIERRETLPHDGPAEQYGLGNATFQQEGFVGHGHSGYTLGFVASFRYFPREGVGWALMLNSWEPGGAQAAIEHELLGFLMQGQERPTPMSSEPGPSSLAELAGYYRDVTPAEEIWAPLKDLLGGTEIEFAGGVLWERSVEVTGVRGLLTPRPAKQLVPTGNDGFRHSDEVLSSRFFVQSAEGRTALVTPAGQLERDSRWTAVAQRLGLVGLGLVLLSAVTVAPLWLIQGLAAGQGPGELAARALPLLAVLTALAALVILKRSPESLGVVNATTLAIFALSVAYPALSLAGLWAVVRVPAVELGVLAKGHLLLVAIACVGLALFAWRAHWIGIRTWSW